MGFVRAPSWVSQREGFQATPPCLLKAFCSHPAHPMPKKPYILQFLYTPAPEKDPRHVLHMFVGTPVSAKLHAGMRCMDNPPNPNPRWGGLPCSAGGAHCSTRAPRGIATAAWLTLGLAAGGPRDGLPCGHWSCFVRLEMKDRRACFPQQSGQRAQTAGDQERS